MHADYFPAPGTGPFLLLSLKKPLKARLPNIQEVFNHTHAIFGSISFIHVLDPAAGEIVTFKTEGGLIPYPPFTIFYSTVGAVFGERVGSIATRTSFLFSGIGSTEPAVHPARGDQFRFHRFPTHNDPPFGSALFY
jgi:hypothetical protein